MAASVLTAQDPIPPETYSDAFMPEGMFQRSYLTLVNGDTNHAGPMIRDFLGANGAGNELVFGGGQFAKVGLKGRMFYLNGTEGADPDFEIKEIDPYDPNNNHYKYYINRGPTRGAANTPEYVWPLPPDVTSLTDLPDLVLFGLDGVPGGGDDLPDEQQGDAWTATLSRFPGVIANLEWARYLNVPISYETFRIFNQGGHENRAGYDVNNLFEAYLFTDPLNGDPVKGTYQCSLDASGYADPNNDPTDFESAGAKFGLFTFATPTMADPDLSEEMAADDLQLRAVMGDRLYYMDYCRRNLQDGLEQLLTIARDAIDPATGLPRYRDRTGTHGLIAGFSIESEIKIPAHWNRGDPLEIPPIPPARIPQHPDYNGGGLVSRPFCEDYHPVVIRMFQNYLEDKYGDATPLEDSNGDGRSFFSDHEDDYLASGWVSATPAIDFPHTANDFSSWKYIDAPRKYPEDGQVERSNLWHEWLNFRAQLVSDTLDRYVSWWVDAGVPATRMFSHMSPAKASSYENRCVEPLNREQLDEWQAIETSGAYAGINKYWLDNFGSGDYLLEQLHRRDDGWASPEWAPSRMLSDGTFPPAVELREIIDASWRTRGHAMHYHSWGNFDYNPYDQGDPWVRDSATRGLVGWTNNNFKNQGSSYLTVDLPNVDAYLELATPLQAGGGPFWADEHPYFVLRIQNLLSVDMDNLRVDFKKPDDPKWYCASETVLRDFAKPSTYVVLDLRTSQDWTGKIEGLRIYPCPRDSDAFKIEAAWTARQSDMTRETQGLLTAIQSIGRPLLPSAKLLGEDALLIAAQIEDYYHADPNQANLVVYGTEPVEVSAGEFEFSDFDYVGNFESVDMILGGVELKSSIAATPPTFLGNSKTGRFRQLRLPNVDQGPFLHFAKGLNEVALMDGDDGVEFRVKVRRHDGSRELSEIFRGEWREPNQWSDPVTLDLSGYAGETVDIHFETHSIADPNRDAAVWGRPVLYAAPPVADFAPQQTVIIAQGSPVTFTDQSTQLPTSWVWTVDNGGAIQLTSTEQNPTFTFDAAGTYSVSLTAANPAGADDEVKSTLVIVSAPPVQVWQASDDFSSVQGHRNWYYESADGMAFNPMTWEAGNSRWKETLYAGNCLVYADRQHPSARQSCRIWQAPSSGDVRITGECHRSSATSGASHDGVTYTIEHLSAGVLTVLDTIAVASDDTSSHPFDETVSVSAGDRILFRLDRNDFNASDTLLSDPLIELTVP